MGSEPEGDVAGEKISPYFAEIAQELHVSRAKALYTPQLPKFYKIFGLMAGVVKAIRNHPLC